MNPRFIVAFLLAALFGGAAWFLVLPQQSGERVDSSPERSDSSDSLLTRSSDDRLMLTPDMQNAAYAASLREKYLDRIHDPVWQVKLLDHLINLMKKVDPDNWRARVEQVLMLAFPDLVDTLLERLAAMLAYEEWLANTLPFMTFESSEERYQALWATRLALFGEDANLIWASELVDRRFRQQLSTLDATDAPLTEKAEQYVDLLRETYGDMVFGNQGYNTTQMMGDFLQLGSIQEELRSATAREQDELLRTFRQQMGLDNAALTRWELLDDLRRNHRISGEAYMAERQNLAGTLSGEALTQALLQLQVEHFGEEEARFIQNEEASGVFRFKVPQVIGVD